MTARKSAAQKAGEKAAERTNEEQEKALEDAKEPTDKQQEELEAAAGTQAPAPDDTAGTDVDLEAAKRGDDEESSEAEQAEPSVTDSVAADVDSKVVRHSDQRKGVTSASAFVVGQALGLKSPSTEWDDSLDEAIRAYQEGIGQKPTGYVTRDQCRRLGLTLIA